MKNLRARLLRDKDKEEDDVRQAEMTAKVNEAKRRRLAYNKVSFCAHARVANA